MSQGQLLSGNRVTVGVADDRESSLAGRAAVGRALKGSPEGIPRCALLFSTSRHDPAALLASVREALGYDVPVYGGYAVGIISPETLGYDGFQIGLALFWFAGAELEVIVGTALHNGEKDVGETLIRELCARTFRGSPSLILLYDSVNRTGNRFRLNVATSLLAGGFDRLPRDIPLVGAGLVGDMQLRSTHQWTGDKIETQSALLFAFSGDIEIEQIVLHGCRPASAYHRITRVDDNVVLEIDGRPALDVVADLLGPDSGRSWKDYRFFVTLGVNKGEMYGPFDPNGYANRMCMAIDAERRGLVMFEPDLREGDLVQLMLRSVDHSYIGDKIGAFLDERPERKPIFALYIDCAGRASAYSHVDEEEATYVQAALKDVCPLLGFYSGVEIARVVGAPQALDWTGVLCLFFEREALGEPACVPLDAILAPALATSAPAEEDPQQLPVALDYYRRHLDKAAGEQVRFDARLSALNRRLRQKEEGFRVLASLRETIDVRRTSHEVYRDALGLILSSMAIDRAVVLELSPEGRFRAVARAGYPDSESAELDRLDVDLPGTFDCLIANESDKSADLARLRLALGLPFFLGVPIPDPRRQGVLFVGRQREIKPFFPPFDLGDADNFKAIASFLASVTDNIRLYAAAEAMAASFRRFVPEAFLKIINRSDFSDIALGDQVGRHMSVLVTDIRSFTTLSERMTPQQVFAFVNDFLAEVGPVVRAHDGFINKYIGDAVMALFDRAEDGLRAAVALIKQIETFNVRRRLDNKFPIQIGVAVNSGDLMLGAIGEKERLEGSVLADAVNLTFRLEGLTKTYGAQILTTEDTLAELPEGTEFTTRPIDFVTVKGRRKPITILEVLDGYAEERLEKKLSTRDLFTSGFQNFEFGAYEEAARTFRKVAKLDPDDRAARAMMLKARKLAEGESYVDE